MKEPWAVVPLEKVMTQRKESIQIDDLMTYKRCRVQLHAHGIVLRDTIFGAEIKTKKQQVCHANDFLVAEIDAKVGGFGIVPEGLEGSIVSSHYFLFDLNDKSLDRRFLDYFIRTKYFQDQVAAQGSTNYAAIRPEDVLRYAIPLPALEEQRRIVIRIEELAARIENARELRKRANADIDKLLITLAHHGYLEKKVKLQKGWKEVKLKDVIAHVVFPHDTKIDQSYPNLGIYSFGKGLFKKSPIDGAKTSAKKLYRVKSGQFIYSKLFAFEGAYGLVTSEYDGFFVSNEYPTFECNPTKVIPEFIYAYFKSPKIWNELANKGTGIGDRRQRVHPEEILNHMLLIPPIEYQELISKIFYKLDPLKRHQVETTVELDALLPAVLERAFRGEV